MLHLVIAVVNFSRCTFMKKPNKLLRDLAPANGKARFYPAPYPLLAFNKNQCYANKFNSGSTLGVTSKVNLVMLFCLSPLFF